MAPAEIIFVFTSPTFRVDLRRDLEERNGDPGLSLCLIELHFTYFGIIFFFHGRIIIIAILPFRVLAIPQLIYYD